MIFLTSTGESAFQLIIVLCIFACVLFASYYVTKWIAGYQKQVHVNRNLEIIDMIKIASDKSVQIVRAGENKFFVIALGKTEVTLLGEITEEDLLELDEIEQDKSQNGFKELDFKSILNKISKKN